MIEATQLTFQTEYLLPNRAREVGRWLAGHTSAYFYSIDDNRIVVYIPAGSQEHFIAQLQNMDLLYSFRLLTSHNILVKD